MSQVEIVAGICGFRTRVEARMDGEECVLTIASDCATVQRLASALARVDPFREISYRGQGPLTFELARQYLPHPACPVPVGVIKAIEVEAGLALPADASIAVRRSE